MDQSAPVAQLDRAAGFEPVGREFESLRAHQIPKSSSKIEGSHQEFGRLVAVFSLASIDGSRTLRDHLAGEQEALIALWSGVCTHCVRYDLSSTWFAELHPQLGFVAIATHHGETRAEMLDAVTLRGL